MGAIEERTKCYEYINAVKESERYAGQGIYGLDRIRERTHDELCKIMGLDKAVTKQCTDYLDRYNYNGTELYVALFHLKESETTKGEG